MKSYTFDMRASVTIDEDTEHEARATLKAACEYQQNEDIYFGAMSEVMVSLSASDSEKALLREVYNSDGTIKKYSDGGVQIDCSELAEDLRRRLSTIIGGALSGSNPEYRNKVDYVRWGAVERDMHKAIDDSIKANKESNND